MIFTPEEEDHLLRFGALATVGMVLTRLPNAQRWAVVGALKVRKAELEREGAKPSALVSNGRWYGGIWHIPGCHALNPKNCLPKCGNTRDRLRAEGALP